jgi:peptide/nickel transport system substrate-binding protein
MPRSLRAIATALLLAAAPLSAADAQSDPNVLKVAVGGDLKSFDPVWTNTAITTWYANQVYDMLFAYDEKNQIQPQMVGDYKVSSDGLTHDFKLRPGLKFHDGSPVTAEDCVASIKRWAERDSMGILLMQKTKSLEVVDKDTFRFVLKEPYGLVRESLGKRIGPPYIMPARLAKAKASEEIKETIGSGPFKFNKAEWQPGSKVVFDKNPDYVPRAEPASGLAGGKRVYIDHMEWLTIPDVNTKLTALTTGEIDYFDAPPLDFLPIFESNPDLKLVFNDPLGISVILRPNHLFPPFDNKLARQALLYLVNQEQVMQAIVGDPKLYLKFCGAFFMCGSDAESDVGSEPLKKVNVAKAKELLAQAGYKGEPIVIMQPTDRPEHTAATLVIIQALRDAGLNLDVQAADWATITARRAKKDDPKKGGWNLFITGTVGASTTDPLVSLWFMPSCEAAAPGWPCDKEIVDLVAKWSQEADTAKRKALIDQIQAKAYDTVPYIPLGQYQRPHGVRSNIQGILTAGTTVFWNIKKTEE